MMPCVICPRECKVDRTERVGFCGEKGVRIAKIIDGFSYEEPCVGNVRAVFFYGCNLKCSYCQNAAISRNGANRNGLYDMQKLKEVFDAEAVDLITPTHFLDDIECAAKGSRARVIWNTSGYEKRESVERQLEFVDVFLTDFKYGDDALAEKFSAAGDYRAVATEAIRIMRQKKDVFDSGIMKSGLIVRHLVLPDYIENTLRALDILADTVGTDVTLSLMSQFTPFDGSITRRLKPIEYKIACEYALKKGFHGYFQELDSAQSAYTPDFLH